MMLLYADCLFYTTVRFYGSFFFLHDWTILRIYDATVRRLSVLFSSIVRFYASTFLRLILLKILHFFMYL